MSRFNEGIFNNKGKEDTAWIGTPHHHGLSEGCSRSVLADFTLVISLEFRETLIGALSFFDFL